ncbi:hypothetical protein GF325_05175 [Candidatus Bathyarchaeota archaeon]|nr:hypothetical protein [Candidatus Bathyarchaeota archaeon]
MIFTTIIVISALPVIMGEVVKLPGLENYLLAVPFILPSLFKKLFSAWVSFTDGALAGSKKVIYLTFIRVIEEVNEVLFVWLWLYVFKLHIAFGFAGVVFILSFEHAFPKLIKTIMGFAFVHRKIVKVKVNMWQSFIVPTIASLPLVLTSVLFYFFALDPLKEAFSFMGEWAAIGPIVIMALVAIIIMPLFVYMPLSGYLGGWDDFQLKTLEKAIMLVGPVKPFIKIFYKTITFGTKRSKLHNRFKIDWTDAAKEINELMDIKRQQVEQGI